MKVIEQLVSYLTERGRLSPDQLAYLHAEGYCARPAGAEAVVASPADPAPPSAGPPKPASGVLAVWPDDEIDRYAAELEQALARRPAVTPRRARAAAQRQRRAWAHAALAAHLGTRLPTWDEHLGGLVQLARHLTPAATWPEAACRLRKARGGTLVAALAEGLAGRRPALPLLWEALSFDARRALDGLPRSARHAYAAWLDAATRGASGGVVRLPRGREVAAVCNLVRAQRSVLAACGQLYATDPRLVARALRRDHHPGAYLAFAMVHTARKAETPPRPTPPDEHCPRRPLPDGAAAWQRAWEQALLMDPRHVRPFYRACLHAGAAPGQRDGEALGLVCPAEWDRGYLPAWAVGAPVMPRGESGPGVDERKEG